MLETEQKGRRPYPRTGLWCLGSRAFGEEVGPVQRFPLRSPPETSLGHCLCLSVKDDGRSRFVLTPVCDKMGESPRSRSRREWYG